MKRLAFVNLCFISSVFVTLGKFEDEQYLIVLYIYISVVQNGLVSRLNESVLVLYDRS